MEPILSIIDSNNLVSTFSLNTEIDAPQVKSGIVKFDIYKNSNFERFDPNLVKTMILFVVPKIYNEEDESIPLNGIFFYNKDIVQFDGQEYPEFVLSKKIIGNFFDSIPLFIKKESKYTDGSDENYFNLIYLDIVYYNSYENKKNDISVNFAGSQMLKVN